MKATSVPALRTRTRPSRALAILLATTLATLGVSVGGAFVAAPAFAAAGDPFPAATPLVFIAQGSPTGLFKAVQGPSGAVTFTAEGPVSPVTYNAIAYNPADNFLYGINSTTDASRPDLPVNSLIRIGQGGVITRVGTNPIPLANAGAFGPDGLYYTTFPGSHTLNAFNVTTGLLDHAVNLPVAWVAADIAFSKGFIWGVAASSPSTIGRLDPVSGDVTTFPIPFMAPNDGAGAAWTFGNGNLGFSQNGSGTVTQVAVTNPGAATPTFTMVSQTPGPSSAFNDGAASGGLPVDLTIVKTGPSLLPVGGGTITYTLTVTNNGPGVSSGYAVNDPIPAGLTGAATTTPGCSITSGVVNCAGGALALGASATITITATSPAGLVGPLTNTATVLGNETDPTPGNNSSTSTAGGTPSVKLVKSAGAVVDANGDARQDAGDTITYTFAVTNTGNVPLNPVTVADPRLVSAHVAITCPTGAVDPGDTVTCTAQDYTVTQADIVAGSLRNVATAGATGPGGDPVDSDPAEADLPTAPLPALAFTGTDVSMALVATAALLGIGLALVIIQRRRRRS
jgi:uncharacterized repeat protein (TIGR01451 family)